MFDCTVQLCKYFFPLKVLSFYSVTQNVNISCTHWIIANPYEYMTAIQWAMEIYLENIHKQVFQIQRTAFSFNTEDDLSIRAHSRNQFRK